MESSGALGGSAARSTLAALAVAAMVGWVIYLRLVLLHRPPGWDEAAHSLHALRIAHDVRTGDALAFLLDSYRQVYWPPLHSWMVGAAFLLAGPSMDAARAVSVLAFVLLAPTLFVIGRLSAPRHPALAGGVAAALALSSPGLIVYAAQSMLELPGLLMMGVTTLIYCWLERHPGAPPRRHALLGVAIMATYLTKSNYGILLILALALTKLVDARFRVGRLFTRANLMAALPVVVISALWFAYPPKITATWDAMVNQPWGGEAARGVAGLLFYPRALSQLVGGRILFVVLWVALVLAWRAPRTPGVRLLLALALLQFAIAELHHTKLTRHIMPMLPAMYVLAGVAVADLRERSRGRVAAGRLLWAGVAAVIVIHGWGLVRRDWPSTPRRSPDELLAYVASATASNGPALVVGTKEAWPGPPVVDWHLAAVVGVLPVTSAGAIADADAERRLRERLREGTAFPALRAAVARRLGRYDAPSSARSYHLGIPFDTPRATYERDLERLVTEHSTRAIVAIVSTSDTTHYPAALVTPAIERLGFHPITAQDFTEATARVYVFRRD
jgi:4-amino-4-deoxy-L-arabinose transferase-like glycosyltransferase